MAESIALKGKVYKLKGEVLKEGELAPDCALTNADLEDVRLSKWRGKTLLLMTLPSLDTSVCSTEARRFNQEIAHFSNLTALAVSMDLPFAQKRWCAAEGIKNLIVLSDYKRRELGEKFGLLIPDLGLLARAVYILDPDMHVLHAHLVKETTEEPNYKVILEELSERVA